MAKRWYMQNLMMVNEILGLQVMVSIILLHDDNSDEVTLPETFDWKLQQHLDHVRMVHHYILVHMLLNLMHIP
jgi:hypothetical protein